MENPLESAQQDLAAAHRQISHLQKENEKQRQKIIELRREKTHKQQHDSGIGGSGAPPTPVVKDMFSHKKGDTADDKEEARIMKLKFAWYRHHLIMSSKLKMRVARAFDKWKNNAMMMERRAEMRREHLKNQVQQSKIKAERGKIDKIVKDMHRIRMEKVCLLLLGNYREGVHERAILEIREKADKEKKELLEQLRLLYYQLQLLNDTEEQEIEAAKKRSEGFGNRIENTGKVLQAWLEKEKGAAVK